MEKLIYYPNFEPPSDNWLKFALLFFEDFKSIVPYDKQHLISDNYRKILDSTDLVSLYSPGYDEGNNATLNAIEEASKIISNPYRRSFLFNNVNILRKWQTPSNWEYEICEEKFSHDWISFCVENQIGIRTSNGILLSEELGFLFMTYLAKEIAFADDASIITDNFKFDTFTNYSKGNDVKLTKRNDFAKEIINLVLPGDIHEISFDTLIDFRRRNRELIRAFNVELDNVQSKIGQGYTGTEFITDYKKAYKELYNAILAQGHGIMIIPLTAYILINNPFADSADYIKEIIGSLGIIHSGFYSINKGLKETKTRRYCKKYLTNLEQIK